MLRLLSRVWSLVASKQIHKGGGEPGGERGKVDPEFVRVGFWRTDFLQISIFEPPVLLFADLAAGVSRMLEGKVTSAQKSPPGNPWQKPRNLMQHKSPTHFCRFGRAKSGSRSSCQ